MQARRLILTADDFGVSPAVNAAVEQWHRAGALTHASLMVNEPHAADAVALARALPGLQVGLHLTLADGLGSDGHPMPRSHAWAGLRFAFSPAARKWLKSEIATQFQRFKDLGLPPTHWDGHAHLHLHPVVLRIALPIARAHGFSFTRLVREPGPAALIPWIFRRLSQRALPALRAAGMSHADRVFGLRNSGKMTQAVVDAALCQAQSGVTEIYFHPGAEAFLQAPPLLDRAQWEAQ